MFVLQPGQLGFQVAYPLVKTVQLGGQELARPAYVAEESLRHDGSLPASPRMVRPPCHHRRLQTRCSACGGGMEMSMPSSSSLRRVCMPAHDSRASWPPPDAPREAVSAHCWAVLQGVFASSATRCTAAPADRAAEPRRCDSVVVLRAVAESNRRENDLHRASEKIAFEACSPHFWDEKWPSTVDCPHLGPGVGNSATARLTTAM